MDKKNENSKMQREKGGTESEEEIGLCSSQITDSLFADILKGIDDKGTLVHWRPSTLNTENSILCSMAAEDEEIKCFVGHIAYKITYHLPGDSDDEYHDKYVVLKAKARSSETTEMLYHLASNIGGEYGKVWKDFQDKIGFSNTDHREIEALRLTDKAVVAITPYIFHTLLDEPKDLFVYVMENFVKEGYTHMDTVDDISVWSIDDIKSVLQGIAGMHARYYGRASDLPQAFLKWLDVPTKKSFIEKLPLWKVTLKHNSSSFPNIWDNESKKMLEAALENIDKIADILDNSPTTLVHNDFSVRNICFRPKPTGVKTRLCVYDWELATVAPPQHDIAEFLSGVLPSKASVDQWKEYVDIYREYFVEELSKVNENGNEPEKRFENVLQPDAFMKIFDMSVLELLINRFSLYGLPHTFRPYSFLERIITNATEYMKGVKNKYDFLM